MIVGPCRHDSRPAQPCVERSIATLDLVRNQTEVPSGHGTVRTARRPEIDTAILQRHKLLAPHAERDPSLTLGGQLRRIALFEFVQYARGGSRGASLIAAPSRIFIQFQPPPFGL